MTSPAFAPLQPMGVGKLIDRAVRLYRDNFLTFVGIVALAQIPLTLLQIIFAMLTIDSTLDATMGRIGAGYAAGVGGSVLVTIASFVLIQGVATAALTRAVANRYLGEPASVFEAYAQIGSDWWTLVRALLLAFLIGIGLFIWTLVPCVGWLTGPGLMSFLGFVLLPLVAPVVVLERHNARRAVRRAWDLARRRFWWLVGFMFVLAILGQVLITGPASLIALVTQFTIGDPLTPGQTQLVIQTLVQALVQLAVSLVYLPFQLGAVTLLYFDLRVRTEGFDLALLAASGDGEGRDVAELTSAAPRAVDEKLVSRRDLVNFFLLTLAVVAVYLIFALLFSVASLGIMGGLLGS